VNCDKRFRLSFKEVLKCSELINLRSVREKRSMASERE